MWDEQIDEAAREETIGSPGGDFTARILASIEGRNPAEAGSHVRQAPDQRRWIWIAAPLAAAAVLAIALVIDYGGREMPSPARDAAMSTRGDVPLPSDRTAPMPSVAVDPGRPPRGPARPAVAAAPSFVSRMLEPGAVDDGDVIVITPLEIAPIQVNAMEIADSEIPLLSVSAIDVPALDLDH